MQTLLSKMLLLILASTGADQLLFESGQSITVQAHMLEGTQSIKGVVSRMKQEKIKRTPLGFVFS